MQMFFSASTLGWYCDEVHGENKPSDAIAVSDDLYAECQGRRVIAGSDGLPRVYVEPPPTVADLIVKARAEIRVQRQPIIEILDGLQISALTKGELSRAQEIETAKQGLRDLTDIDLTECENYEAMRLKVKARYIQLATALPLDVRRAFSEAIN